MTDCIRNSVRDCVRIVKRYYSANVPERPPLDEEFLRARHQGKSDRGELPPRFAPFIDEIRAAVRARHYSYRTEQTYVGWITRFLAYAAPEKRQDLHPSQAKDYLDYLSVVRRVSSATQPSGAR